MTMASASLSSPVRGRVCTWSSSLSSRSSWRHCFFSTSSSHSLLSCCACDLAATSSTTLLPALPSITTTTCSALLARPPPAAFTPPLRRRRRRRFASMASATSFFEFKTKDKSNQPYDLAPLTGKVVLVVNTASKCGFTPQFAGLEKLYQELKQGPYADQVEILGFPCNQFGGQDPGSNEEIQQFCQVNYGVSFPVLGKVDVNGDNADPVFEWLKNEKPGIMGLKRVKWNFEKFLVGKDGKVKGRWASTKKPEDLKVEIERALKE